MVQINLTPKTIRQRPKTEKLEKLDGQWKELIPVLGAITVVCVCVWLIMIAVLIVGKIKFYGIDKKWQQVSKTVKEIEDLGKQNRELSSKLEILKNVGAHNFTWSKTLDRISAVVPPEIWLTQVAVERRLMDSGAYNEPSGMGQAARKEFKVLAIRGRSASLKGEEAVGSVGRFLSALKEDTVFAGNFVSINMGPINKSKIGEIDVMIFELFCRFE